MTLASGADAAVILGVVVAVPVYVFNRKRAAGADVLAAMNTLRDEVLASVNTLRDEVRRDVGRIETEVKELRTEVAGIEQRLVAGDRRLVAVETILAFRHVPVGAPEPPPAEPAPARQTTVRTYVV